MSFYRTFIAAVAAMGLATAVFAADQNTSTQPMDTNSQATTQTNDTQASATQTNDEAAKVDLNKASSKELMKVKGINATKAKAIVAYRKAHGDFKSVDDLKDVKGFKKISEKAMKKIQDQLTTS